MPPRASFSLASGRMSGAKAPSMSTSSGMSLSSPSRGGAVYAPRTQAEGEGIGTGWYVAGGLVLTVGAIAGGILAVRKYNEARATGAAARAQVTTAEADLARAQAENKRAAGEGDAARITADNALVKRLSDSLAAANDARAAAESARDEQTLKIGERAAARAEELARWGQAGVDRRDDCYGCGAIYCTNAAAINEEDEDRAPEWFRARGKTGLTCQQLRSAAVGCASVGVRMPCMDAGCSNGRQQCRDWIAETKERRNQGLTL